MSATTGRVTGMSHMVEVEGLVKRYGKTTALAGVDLAVRAGTVLGLLGPNGAGKTTAVRILATPLRPDGGQAPGGGGRVGPPGHPGPRPVRAARAEPAAGPGPDRQPEPGPN